MVFEGATLVRLALRLLTMRSGMAAAISATLIKTELSGGGVDQNPSIVGEELGRHYYCHATHMVVPSDQMPIGSLFPAQL